MRPSPTWEPKRSSAIQAIPHILWYPKFRYPIQEQLFLFWIMPNQTMTLHPSSWKTVWILSTQQHLGLPYCIFSFRSTHQSLYTPFLSPTRATCPTHLILDLTNRIIFGKEYSSRSCSLCILFQSAVTSSHSDANMSHQYKQEWVTLRSHKPPNNVK